VPVLREGASRMTLPRAIAQGSSEHGENYFDSRLMIATAVLRQTPSARVRNCERQ
jgi:hypothetical protein